MEMCYDGALVMPNNYAVISEEEMTYIDGGELTVSTVVAIVGGLIAAGYGVMNIGKHCGEWCYNNGYARDGWAKSLFVQGYSIVLGLPGAVSSPLFSIGFDNGWVAASK